MKKRNKIIAAFIIAIIVWISGFYLYTTYQKIEITPSNYEANRTQSTINVQNVENAQEKSQKVADMLEETTKKVVGISKLK